MLWLQNREKRRGEKHIVVMFASIGESMREWRSRGGDVLALYVSCAIRD
jgi:hypothetical protein